MNASGNDFSPRAAARWRTTRRPVAAKQSLARQQVALDDLHGCARRDRPDDRLETSQVARRPARQRMRRNPRSRSPRTTRAPMNPAAPVIRIGSSGPTIALAAILTVIVSAVCHDVRGAHDSWDPESPASDFGSRWSRRADQEVFRRFNGALTRSGRTPRHPRWAPSRSASLPLSVSGT